MRHIVRNQSQKRQKMALVAAMGLVFLWTFTLIGCQTRSTPVISIKDYYFPIHKLDGGMMFVYKYKNSLMPEFYWHLKTQSQADTVYLKIVELRDDFSVQQRLTEQILPSGSRIIDYTMMQDDSTGHDEAVLNILSGDSYPFQVKKDGGVYIFQTSWFFSKNPELKYTLVRNRRYAGDTSFVFKGNRFPAIVMKAKELIITDFGGRQELTFDKTEIYAKGLGLVSSKTQLNDTMNITYQLVDTIAGNLLEPIE